MNADCEDNLETYVFTEAEGSLQESFAIRAAGIGNTGIKALQRAADANRQNLKIINASSQKIPNNLDLNIVIADMNDVSVGSISRELSLLPNRDDVLTAAIIILPDSADNRTCTAEAKQELKTLYELCDTIIEINKFRISEHSNKHLSTEEFLDLTISLSAQAASFLMFPFCPGKQFTSSLGQYEQWSMLKNSGRAIFSSGRGKGPSFIEEALHNVLHSPQLKGEGIKSARGIMVLYTVNPKFSISGYRELCTDISACTEDSAARIFELNFDYALAEDEIVIELMAVGLPE